MWRDVSVGVLLGSACTATNDSEFPARLGRWYPFTDEDLVRLSLRIACHVNKLKYLVRIFSCFYKAYEAYAESVKVTGASYHLFLFLHEVGIILKQSHEYKLYKHICKISSLFYPPLNLAFLSSNLTSSATSQYRSPIYQDNHRTLRLLTIHQGNKRKEFIQTESFIKFHDIDCQLRKCRILTKILQVFPPLVLIKSG
jgi:hypothetical protein